MQMILLDTHALIWMSADPKRLSKKARDAIREARQSSGLAVATITLWELALLAQRGRIHVAGTVESFVRETVSRVILRPMTPRSPPSGKAPRKLSKRSRRPLDWFHRDRRRISVGYGRRVYPGSKSR